MTREQLARAWYVTVKDIRTYYLKAPLISWGIVFPLVMMLASYLRSPGDIASAAPGLIALTVLFGATSVEAVVITFEKRIGAMERLVMAPLTHHALLLGKVASGALFGLATGVLVWLASALAFGLDLRWGAPLVVIALGSVTFALLGVLISLAMREVFDAMSLSNFVRVPMIFLCGVFTPLGSMAPWLRGLASALPLTYTVDALRQLTLGDGLNVYPLWFSLAATAGFGLVLYMASYALLRRRLEDLIA